MRLVFSSNFSPGFDGHRQIYAYVMLQIPRELGCNVFIAGDRKGKVSDRSDIEGIKREETSLYREKMKEDINRN